MLQPYAELLTASEHLVPGSGADYRCVRAGQAPPHPAQCIECACPSAQDWLLAPAAPCLVPLARLQAHWHTLACDAPPVPCSSLAFMGTLPSPSPQAVAARWASGKPPAAQHLAPA